MGVPAVGVSTTTATVRAVNEHFYDGEINKQQVLTGAHGDIPTSRHLNRPNRCGQDRYEVGSIFIVE